MATGTIAKPITDTTKTLTPTITKTSGNSVYVESGASQSGKMVTVYANFLNSGSAVNAGSNSFVGSISGIPLPAVRTTGIGYYGSSIFMSPIETDGSLIIRVLAAQLPSTTNPNNKYGITWTYMTS